MHERGRVNKRKTGACSGQTGDQERHWRVSTGFKFRVNFRTPFTPFGLIKHPERPSNYHPSSDDQEPQSQPRYIHHCWSCFLHLFSASVVSSSCQLVITTMPNSLIHMNRPTSSAGSSPNSSGISRVSSISSSRPTGEQCQSPIESL